MVRAGGWGLGLRLGLVQGLVQGLGLVLGPGLGLPARGCAMACRAPPGRPLPAG